MEKKSFLSGTAYDVLKWIALIALDALGLCYSTVAAVWGLPYGDQVMKTCAAVSVLIAALIQVSKAQYDSSGKEEQK